MSEHRYTLGALRGDYARAAFGLAICAIVLLGVGVGGVVLWLFLGLTALFGYFAWRTWVRQRMVVTLDGEGIAAHGVRNARLDWRDLRSLKLKFYATRRNRREGWMELTIKSAGTRLSLDSHIEDFATIADRAHQAATANGLVLSNATMTNFAALGLGESSRMRWGDLRQALSPGDGGNDTVAARARRQP